MRLLLNDTPIKYLSYRSIRENFPGKIMEIEKKRKNRRGYESLKKLDLVVVRSILKSG